VVSLLPSSHNLAAYEEEGLTCTRFSFPVGGSARDLLFDLYGGLNDWIGAGERVLLHHEELGEKVLGVVAGYLLWSSRLPGGPQAIVVIERLAGRQLGPLGRQMVADAAAIPPPVGHGGGG
jgi:hypothetical protein